MDSFYMTLPSNVKTNASENAVSHYRTTLASPIYLNGEYEVALVECSFPRSLAFEPMTLSINITIVACLSYVDYRYDQLLTRRFNPNPSTFESHGQVLTSVIAPHHTTFNQFYQRTVQKYPNPWQQCHAKLWKFQSTTEKRLDKIYSSPIVDTYDNVDKIIDDINDELRLYVLNHEEGKAAELQLLDNGQVIIHPGWQTSLSRENTKYALYFPLINEPTASILGLSHIMERIRNGDIPYTATRRVDAGPRFILEVEKEVSLAGYQRAAFPKPFEYLLYSNLPKHSICGENFYQLLRRIDIPDGDGLQCSTIYTHPYYLPLATNPIIDVLIEYRDDVGNYANFADNTRSCVVLHFRKVIKAALSDVNLKDV